MIIAHVLPSSIHTHGGLPLLARKLAIGMFESHSVYVICPERPEKHVNDAPGLDALHLIEWRTNLNNKEIAKFIKKFIEHHQIQLVVFHGGDFSWGLLDNKISAVNSICRKKTYIFYVNHQSNTVFQRLPTGQPQTALTRVKSCLRFISAWTLKNIQLMNTDVEICVSQFEYKQARLRYFLFKKKFRLVYHSRLASTPIGLKIIENKKNSILSVGHFAFRKGQHILLRAFGRISAQHPHWNLCLVGANSTSEYRSMLESIINDFEIEDRVEIITETHRPDDYFKNASIYVQPSLVEAYGLALQEAMHFGCICVGANAGGITDSVQDPRYLFPPGDDRKLASILDGLMIEGNLLNERMRCSLANSHAMQRNEDTMMNSYRKLFAEISRIRELSLRQ